MSVIVEIAPSYRCCNSCGSNDGVIEITTWLHLKNGKQGNQLSLCEKCAQQLRYCLNSRYMTTAYQEESV